MRHDRLKNYINSKPKLEEIFRYCKCKNMFFAIAYKPKRQYGSKTTISSFYNKNDNPKMFHTNYNYERTFSRYILYVLADSISFYGD